MADFVKGIEFVPATTFGGAQVSRSRGIEFVPATTFGGFITPPPEVEPPPDPINAVPPVVSGFTPAAGTQLARTAAIGFDVTDDQGLFSRIMVTVRFAATGVEEVVHDGDGFAPYYTRSTRVPIPGGFRYSILRTGGWPAAPTVRVFPLDVVGNQP